MIKKHIPNFITLLNLLSGCFAIVVAFQGELVLSTFLIGLSLIFDFLDGMTARLLKVKSEIGKQLDSLADLVSFGLVPAVILYQLLIDSFFYKTLRFGDPWLLGCFAFLITLFSALRLAKFNIDESQTLSFKGLPTPANAILIASFPLIIEFHPNAIWAIDIILNTWFLVGIIVLQSFLLVSNIPLMSLKFTDLSWKNNYLRFILIVLSIILVLILQFIAIPLIIVLYIVLSLLKK
ncbi:MAG: CDP-diacylglycerol--serine O-phosphatidyltransferase [Saprospiraceae bacterium]|nr:CDP-diacylglycerol--serine O-phosphatidyltransferase [Saprospiraceae bacterium]